MTTQAIPFGQIVKAEDGFYICESHHVTSEKRTTFFARKLKRDGTTTKRTYTLSSWMVAPTRYNVAKSLLSSGLAIEPSNAADTIAVLTVLRRRTSIDAQADYHAKISGLEAGLAAREAGKAYVANRFPNAVQALQSTPASA